MSVIADSREPDKHPFETETLDCGDYVITGKDGGIIIERKEYTDLVNSYRSGKLYQQLRMCKEQEEYHVVLLIEGSRQNAIRYANATNYEIDRYLSALVARNPDVQLVYSRNFNQTIKLVKYIGEWYEEDSVKTHRIREAEKVPPAQRPRYIVEGLSSIGPNKAERLLDHFGNVRNVFTATKEELQEVPGIGAKTASQIVDEMTR